MKQLALSRLFLISEDRMGKFFTLMAATTLVASSSWAQPRAVFKNIETLRETYRIDKALKALPEGKKLKIAVLDKGWDGVEAEVGKTLPRQTRYFKGTVPVPADLKSNHGLRMAQIISEMLGKEARDQRLELQLYQVYGFTNFKKAIDALVKNPPHLVLYSEVWELGGNFDGGGFINAEVSRATKAGILWVNAAGNFGTRTWNSKIDTQDDDWVKLPDQNNGWKIICEAPKNKTCGLKVVLSWNDFKDDSQEGTQKDLDLALLDDMLNILKSSTLRQSDNRNENRPGFSKYPREAVAAELKAGTYFVRVKNISNNFRGSDRMRLTADGDFLKIASYDENETLLNPADNPDVITIGAIDSERSSRSVKLGRPDLWALSSIVLQDNNEFRGTSNAAAIAAVSIAVTDLYNRERGHKLTREQMIKLLSTPSSWEQGGLSMRDLNFGPVNSNCFTVGVWEKTPEQLQTLVSLGGIPVLATDGWKVMTSYDPWIFSGQKKANFNDRLIVSENGLAVASRYMPQLPGTFEIVQRPLEAGPCSTPAVKAGQLMRPF